MILLFIYLGISLLTQAVFWMCCVEGAHEFRKRYPHIKIPKSHWSSKINTVIRVIIMSITPIFNLLMLLYIVFKTEEVIEGSIYKLHNKYASEEDKLI
jgi:hypothetical protein